MGAIRILLPALLAISGLVSADNFGDLSNCGQNCINNLRESIPCVPVTNECLCEDPDFQSGIRDCADQACSASDATAAIDYASSFCLSATGITSTTAAATSTSEAALSTSEAAVITSSTPATTTAAESTTEPTTSSAETTASTTSSAESSTTSAATTDASSSDASSTASSSAATETSSASGTASESSTGTETSSPASSSSAAGTPPATNGLSVAAKAGVAVGAGAAGVALLALAIAMCKSKRARRPLPRGTMQISEPLPGSGRIDYSVPNQPQMSGPGSKLSTAFNMGDLDTARPYEEMVPRVTPRRMV